MTEGEVVEHIKTLRTDRNSSLWDERTQGGAKIIYKVTVWCQLITLN